MYTIETKVYTMKTQILSTRLEEKYSSEIEHFADEFGYDRSSFIKHLILESLKGYKLKYAFEKYRKKEVSLSRASELACIPLYDLIGKMEEFQVELNYSTTDLEDDLKTIQSL